MKLETNVNNKKAEENAIDLEFFLPSKEMLMLVDDSYRVVIFNQVMSKKFKEKMGVELKKGVNLLEISPANKSDLIKTYLDKAFEGQAAALEIKLNDHDKSLYLHCSFTPAKNNAGNIAAVVVATKDITEKKNQELEIFDAEERWRFALEGSNQGVWDWKIEDQKVFYSNAWKKLLGYEASDVFETLDDWKKLLHPDDLPRMEQHIDNHFSSPGNLYETEFRLRTKQGFYKWILAKGMIVSRDSEGNPTRMLGTHIDISERKKHEEDYKLIFNHNPRPIWKYDRKTFKFLDVNHTAIENYGYSRDEFLAMTVFDLMTGNNADQIKQEIQNQNSAGEIQKLHCTHVKKNGEVIDVDLITRVFEYDKQEYGLMLTEDVTEKVYAEKKIKESENQYKLLFENSPLPTWVYDASTLRFLQVNQAAVNFYGWSKEEFLQISLLDLHLPEDHQKVKSSIKKHNNVPGSVVTCWTHVKKNGEPFLVEINRNAMQYNGFPARLVVVKDITEKVRAKKMIEQSEQQYRSLFQNNPLSSFIYDPKSYYFLEVNDAMVMNYGYTREEFLALTLFDIVHPSQHQKLKARKKASLAPAAITQWIHRAKNGEEKIVEVNSSNMEYNNKAACLIVLKDITDQVKIERQLQETNERYNFVTRATSDIIWDWTMNSKHILWSENYKKLTGWPLLDDNYLETSKCLSRLHPDERAHIEKSMATALSNPSQNIWQNELRYRKADGSYAFIKDRAFIVRNQKGEALRMIGAMQDISHSKYLEEMQALELRVFEVSAIPGISFHDVLKTLINGFKNLEPALVTTISILNIEGEIEIVAPAFDKQDGRYLKLYIEKQKEKLQEAPSVEKNIILSFFNSEDWKHNHPHSMSINWQQTWTMPVHHQDGNPLAFVTLFVNHDKTPSDSEINALARLRNLLRILMVNYLSHEQIRLSNERYSNVLKATHDLVWEWNLETGKFYRNTEGLKKVYGIEKHESIQNVYSWMERIHPEDHIKVQQVINDILHATDQDKFDVEYRFKKDDGEYAFIYDRGIIVRNKEGKPLRMIGAAQNVTDRKNLEQELLRNELELQKSISQATIDTQEEERREIGKELHDNVNQVLTTTKLYLDLSLSSPDLKNDLIKKSSKNIIYVINEIRQLSRSLMDPSIGDLGLVDSINDLVENINTTRKIHVALTADPELEHIVDENQKLMIFRILQEAMNNTIKYAQATSVQLSLKTLGDQLELIIADDGVGFDPHKVKKGAGLKNIQNRVYLAGGKLQIVTAPGKGCKIMIQFPINKNK